MLKVGLRGVFSRKLRAFLTALAVFLGVSLMTGTYVLTDTFTNSFGQIFEESNVGTDVAVVPREAVDSEQGADPPGMPEQLLKEVRKVDGVLEATGGIFAAGVSLIDEDGDRIGSTQAPAFGASVQPKRFDPFDYAEGRPPETADEVAVDKLSADREDLAVGDQITVAGNEAARQYEIVGIATLGEVDSFGGATVAILPLSEAQRLADKVGEFDQISIAAEEGVDPVELKRRVAAVMPASVEVRTGEENAQQQTDDIEDDLGFLKIALLIFAWIALFVGAFTIFNTFSITVAQRTREFGMLRTLGASRRQVLTSVMIEAFVIGVIGAGLGILAGIGVADGLNSLFKSAGIDLPNTGSVIKTRALVVPLLVGMIVTLLAAIIPAVRATRVSPVEALSDQAVAPTRRRRRFVTVLAVLLEHRRRCRDLRRAVRRDRVVERRRVPARAGRRPALLRHRADVAALRGAARVGGRPGARARAQADGPARARERGAQPGPHRHDGRGADDRPGARHLRGRLRGRDQVVDRRRDRQELRRRPDAPARGRLLADPRRRRPRGGAARRSGTGLVAALRRGRRGGDRRHELHHLGGPQGGAQGVRVRLGRGLGRDRGRDDARGRARRPGLGDRQRRRRRRHAVGHDARRAARPGTRCAAS